MRYKTYIIGLALLHFFWIGSLNAQHRPDWTHGFYEKKGSFIYEKVEAIGITYEEAYKAAKQKAIDNSASRFGISGHFSSENRGDSFVIIQDGNKLVRINIIDAFPNAENFQPGGAVYLLVQETNDSRLDDFPDAKYSTSYPASARVLVPGMEQFYKGLPRRGSLFIVGEVVCVGGIILSQSYKANNVSLMNGTHTSMRQSYANKANIWNNISIGCGIAAGLLYIWNIADGLFSEGKGRIFLSDASPLHISPYVTHQSSGLALCINF